MTNTREYAATVASHETFGRMICQVRDQLFVSDGPVANGCPGVAIGPGELFLTGVASCAVELIQVLAKAWEMPLGAVQTEIRGTLGGEAGSEAHQGVTVFDSVHLTIHLHDVDPAHATALVDGFTSRCPLYGSVKVATPEVVVDTRVH